MASDANGGAAGKLILTREGARKLELELEYLKVNRRAEVAERIRTAIAFGDLSENAEYSAAKDLQAFTEGRILDIEEMLRQATVVEDTEIAKDVVGIGNTVRVYDMKFEEENEYTVVGATEADPSHLRVSSESPIGRALLGAHLNDVVDAHTPGGVLKLKVLEITRR